MIRAGWITGILGLLVLALGVATFFYSLWFQPYGGANIGSPFIAMVGLIILVTGVVLLVVGYQDRRIRADAQIGRSNTP